MWSIYTHVRDEGGGVNEGGATVDQATYLQNLAHTSKSLLIGEVGFNVGFSSLAFLESSPDTRVVSFELNSRRSVELAKAFIDSRYPGRHELVIGNSTDTLPRYADEHEARFDLMFIDGDHKYEVALADIHNALRMSKPGAVVVVDDLAPWFPWGVGPAQAWDQAVRSGLIEPIEYVLGPHEAPLQILTDDLRDGLPVDVIEAGRAWAMGRFVAQ
jgi:predicted O-methyltransferase YrrM